MNENKYCQLREAVDNVVAIDAHCHNLVSKNSSVPFLSSFTLAEGAALADTPFTLPFKVIGSTKSTVNKNIMFEFTFGFVEKHQGCCRVV